MCLQQCLNQCLHGAVTYNVFDSLPWCLELVPEESSSAEAGPRSQTKISSFRISQNINNNRISGSSVAGSPAASSSLLQSSAAVQAAPDTHKKKNPTHTLTLQSEHGSDVCSLFPASAVWNSPAEGGVGGSCVLQAVPKAKASAC